MKYKLFIVEDDRGIAEGIRTLAESWEMEVHIAQNFRGVLDEFAAVSPHIVLLDISLPFFNGYHWCQEIRRVSKVPILFLSSAADNMNMVMAMNMGADDFIAKPFDTGVLMAKLQAMLRRSYDFAATPPKLTCRGAVLQDDSTIRYQGEKLELSKNEYRILHILLENKGQVVGREKLMEALWATDCFVDENTLTVNVNRLRKRLGSLGLTDVIGTRFGVGYIVEDEV